MARLTQEALKERLEYDESTGIFRWRPGLEEQHKTQAGKVAGATKSGYIVISIHGKQYGAHRLAWLYVHGTMPKMVFHKNKSRSDNRIANLTNKTKSKRELSRPSQEQMKEYARAYRARRPGYYSERAMARKYAQGRATPPWADTNIMRVFYATRDYLTGETGIQWNVDHVVPLKGKSVCGLHVHTNMAVIPASANFRKSNKFPTNP